MGPPARLREGAQGRSDDEIRHVAGTHQCGVRNVAAFRKSMGENQCFWGGDTLQLHYLCWHRAEPSERRQCVDVILNGTECGPDLAQRGPCDGRPQPRS
jgi:hypothetical protein